MNSQDDEFRSDQRSSDNNNDEESSSLDSDHNLMDIEAEAEYDHGPRSRGDSFDQ